MAEPFFEHSLTVIVEQLQNYYYFSPKMCKIVTKIWHAKILVERLGRLSADSIWARRASGLRASLDKALAQIEKGSLEDAEHFNYLVALGFEILEKAAEEIPVPEDILFGSRDS